MESRKKIMGKIPKFFYKAILIEIPQPFPNGFNGQYSKNIVDLVILNVKLPYENRPVSSKPMNLAQLNCGRSPEIHRF
jgi:hypothetical protein